MNNITEAVRNSVPSPQKIVPSPRKFTEDPVVLNRYRGRGRPRRWSPAV